MYGDRGDTTFGKYQLIANLGHGGMADVYLAVAHGPAGFNKLVVIKRLRPNLAEEPEFLAMFLDEARLAARLNHPNVVQTNEVGEVAGSYFIAMEYLDGQPLNRLMHRATRQGLAVPLELYLRVISDALAGLHHAHELTDFDGSPLSVVHRDASPHNIFVTYDGQTKLVDFGIAKAASRNVETRAGVLKGKIAYMAPEQARCAQLDRRADVFSIGVLLWELLTQQRLWKGLVDVEVLERLMTTEVPRPSSLKEGVPPELEAVCVRALALKPEERFDTAVEMRDEIDRYAEKNLPRASAKDLGHLVIELFADRRRELKTIVEQQLRGVSMGAGGEVKISIVDIPTFAAMTPSGGIPRVSGSAPPPHETTPSNVTPSNVGTPSWNSAAVSASLAPPRRNRLLVLVGAAALGGIIAAVLALRTSPAPAPADSATVPESAAPAATPAAPDTPTTLELRVTASPQGAKILLDDAAVGEGSFVGRFPADGRSHRIRVEAPGYVTQNRIANFDGDVAVEVSLEQDKSDKPGKVGQAAPRPMQPVQQPPPTKPGGPGKPAKRKLDRTSDPWANDK